MYFDSLKLEQPEAASLIDILGGESILTCSLREVKAPKGLVLGLSFPAPQHIVA